MDKQKKENKNSIISKAKKLSTSAASTVANTAKSTASAVGETAVNKVKAIQKSKNEKRQKVINAREQEVLNAMQELSDTTAEHLINLLGDSKVELNKKTIAQIKAAFPIPREQCVLWADAEFGLRPNGIAITNKGVLIKSDVAVFEKKKDDTGKKNKSELYYFQWETFDPKWFTETNDNNKALLVDNKCSSAFINACKKLTDSNENDDSIYYPSVSNAETDELTQAAKVSPTAFAGVVSSEKAVFVEQKASRKNYYAGHGEMAEEALTYLDKLFGKSATVVGRDNAKDGADRLVNGVNIQTKYYKSASGSVEACFAPQNGNYRYINSDGTPMQLEVPRDQYDKALSLFKYKIKEGKVPGATNPDDAERILRKGYLTYKQAVNLTKPGTIESLAYDATTGAVTCTCAFGISFVANMFITWRNTKDIGEAIKAGVYAGFQVFGISFLQHMIASQISRTSLAGTLIKPSQFIVEKIGYKTSAALVNGIRTLSGKAPIYGAAAAKQLAKILRSNVFTSAIAFAVFSVPDTYKLFKRKSSNAQYIKNMSSLFTSIVAGTGGSIGTGMLTAKVAGALGTAVSPGVGTAIGILGGFVCGTAGGAATNFVGNVIHENDSEKNERLFNAIATCAINEYLLDEKEINAFVSELNSVSKKDFKKLFEEIQSSDKQETVIREFLEAKLDKIVAEREHFSMPTDEELDSAFSQLEINLVSE